MVLESCPTNTLKFYIFDIKFDYCLILSVLDYWYKVKVNKIYLIL